MEDLEYKSGTVKYEGAEYEYEAELRLSHEANHGADADGNRGVPMTFLEEVHVKWARRVGTDVVMEEPSISDGLYQAICDHVYEEE